MTDPVLEFLKTITFDNNDDIIKSKLTSPPVKIVPGSSVLDKDKLFFLISGYIRNEKKYSKLLTFVVTIIAQFALSMIYKKYIDILISKNEFNKLGTKNKNKNEKLESFKEDSFYYFNNKHCMNCNKLNCLKFVQNYENEPTERNQKQSNILYNICNEYKCDYCQYFIGHNIKWKYLSYSYSSPRRGRYRSNAVSLQPFPYDYYLRNKDKDIDKNKNNKRYIKCPECKKEMKIIERYSKASQGRRSYSQCDRDTDYCIKCELRRQSIISSYL